MIRLAGDDASVSPAYAVITAVRDEEENVRRLHAALAAQTLPPAAWIIVDTGPSDGTSATPQEVELSQTPVHYERLDLGLTRPIRGGPVVRAFQHGLRLLTASVEVVVKVDADVSFASDHFERLLTEFASDKRLGVASGARFELVRGAWRNQSTGTVEAQCRAYRQECLRQILPFEERLGWDSIDEVLALQQGWNTRLIDGLAFFHHRPVGRRDGSRVAAWFRQGQTSYYLHYRPTYAVLRALYRSSREPAALALAAGYFVAALRRSPRQQSKAFRAHMRERQRLSPLIRVRGWHT